MARLKSVRVYLYPEGIVPAEVESYGQYGQLRQEWRACGKGCERCPHGPYWYLTWHEKGTNKARKRYIGKELPPAPVDPDALRREKSPREIEAHGVIMQLLPRGGRFSMAKVRDRSEMEMSRRSREKRS